MDGIVWGVRGACVASGAGGRSAWRCSRPVALMFGSRDAPSIAPGERFRRSEWRG